MRQIFRITLMGALALFSLTPDISGAIPVSLGVQLGKPLAFVDLDAQTRESLGANLSVGMDVKAYLPDYPFALGVYYETFWGSEYGSLPVSSSGASLSYYPFGKPIVQSDQVGDIYSQSLDLVVYGTLGTGLSFMNIRDQDGAYVFGASAFNIRMAASMDYPVAQTIAIGGSFVYQTTFGGTSPLDETRPTVGITGFSFLAHCVVTLP